MQLAQSQIVPASVEATWQALNDPAFLKDCVPGCDAIEPAGDNAYTVRMSAKVGPVSAKFVGKMTLTDIDPPNAYALVFEGQGGVAGFAKGRAAVKLRAAGPDDTDLTGPATVLEYVVDAQVGGKLAQIGARLLDSAARKIAGDFFTAFVAKMQAST